MQLFIIIDLIDLFLLTARDNNIFLMNFLCIWEKQGKSKQKIIIAHIKLLH